jgi:hypothetical protein
LWQQAEDGSWRIDPKRDALRMANHTRVFHTYPSYKVVEEAVTKQFYSGEGAIQFAPEAIARSNVDLLTTQQDRETFIGVYCNQGPEVAGALLKSKYPEMTEQELEHRLTRYGLNPCFAAGTLVLTREGIYPIENLIGKTVEIHDGNNWVEVDSFRITGETEFVYTITLDSGDTITATAYHTFILEDGTRLQLKDLEVGMHLMTTKVINPLAKGACITDIYYSHIADTVYCCTVPVTHSFTLANGIVVGNCGEITGSDFHCNLSEVHLNNVDPFDYEQQQKVFEAGAIAVATLLNHSFVVPRYALSRSLDPIVGVSFTGLFDFFVHAFGTPWLKWWEAGRPDTEEGLAFKQQEAEYLSRWKEIVHNTVWDYCDRHGLRRPNRCTTVQPAGTKSLLTNASPGWHPPKAQRFIRRITFRRDDPVALACMEYGYTVVPSQSDKDEEGRLLDDPFDPRCTEWLVEIPTEVSWANVPGADEVEISKFSGLAQFDFYMQVQQYYTAHNTSATIEYRENEIEDLSEAIYDAIQNNKGYISAALLARFDANETFPRLPFEPISKEKYNELQTGVKERQVAADFFEALMRYDQYSGELVEAGPAGCDGDKCLLPLAKPE